MQQQDSDIPALLARAKAYDRDAFAEIYRRTLGPVFRYVASRTERNEDAEEVTQEVFLAALSQIQGLRATDEAALFAWLLQIARFKLADRLRAQYRRPTAPLDATAEPADSAPEADAALIAADTRTEVRAALEQLTEDQRDVITCKYLLGFDNERTARQVGKNVNAVNQLHHRALRTLQRLLRTSELRA